MTRITSIDLQEIAEALVAEHAGGTRASFNNRGWDVEGPDGRLIEVKSLRMDEVATRNNLSPIPASSEYDELVVVLFDADLRVTEALRAERAVVEELFTPRKKDGAWVVRVSKLRTHPNVEPLAIASDLLDR